MCNRCLLQVRIAKPSKKAAAGEQRVVIGRLSRNRRKFVTVVGGLNTFPGEGVCSRRFYHSHCHLDLSRPVNDCLSLILWTGSISCALLPPRLDLGY